MKLMYFFLFCLFFSLLINNSYSIVIFGSGDPAVNTDAPNLLGYENSGWQYEGYWGGFTGTPIAPRFFITASHVGGNVGEIFWFQGEKFITTDKFSDDLSDFTLWKVDHEFSDWAPIYLENDEIGKAVVMMGRGTQRGFPTYANCPSPKIIYAFNSDMGIYANHRTKQTPRNAFWAAHLHPIATNIVDTPHLVGWEYGPADGLLRWGTNTIYTAWGSSVVTMFDGDAGYNECAVSVGDSGGAIFIKDNEEWKLDAIIVQTSSYHLYFDARGINGGCENSVPIATLTIGLRLGYRLNWIQSILDTELKIP